MALVSRPETYRPVLLGDFDAKARCMPECDRLQEYLINGQGMVDILPGYCTGMLWEFSGDSLGILWGLSRDTSPHDHSQTIPREYPDSVQSIHRQYPYNLTPIQIEFRFIVLCCIQGEHVVRRRSLFPDQTG